MVAHPVVRFRFVIKSLRTWQALLALVGFALPFALLPLSRAQGAAMRWERVSTYSGDLVVPRVVAGQSAQMRVLYVVGANSGIHLSVDDGKQWSQISGDLPQGALNQVRIVDIAVDLSDASLAYVVVESPPSVPRPMVYWTADMGLTWQPRASLRQERVRAIALDPLSGDPYVITTHDVLRAFVFEDSSKGLTPRERFARGIDDLHWLSISSFDGKTLATSLTINSQSAITLPAAAPTSDSERASRRPIIERSSNGRGAKGTAEALVLYVGTQSRGLNIVVDSAVVGPYLALAKEDEDTLYVRQEATVYALCADPHQPTRIYVGTDQGVYVSQDAGVSWRATAYPLRAQRILALLADPLRAGTLYAGLAGGGVYYSEDAGATWQPLGHGLGHASALSLAMSGSEPRVLYAGTDSGLWRLRLLEPPDRARAGRGK